MKNNYEQEFSGIDVLLAAWFAGEATEAEKAEVENWLSESEENRLYFERSKKAWEASALSAAEHSFNADAAWDKMKSKMAGSAGETQKPSGRKYTWAVAASVAALLGIASLFWFLKNNPENTEPIQLASADRIIEDTLPDGSRISLNKNSTLDYPGKFSGERREVKLSGEAFFNVERDAEHPFVIHAGPVDVKVLGTSFNVDAYPNSDSVHVSVHTGHVQCAVNGETVDLLPGEYAVFDKGKGKFRKGKEDDPNRAAYRDRIFRFNNTPLAIALQEINDAYGCRIVLENDRNRSCPLSTTKVFRNEPVDNIITFIEATANLSARKEGDHIVLEGQGCQ